MLLLHREDLLHGLPLRFTQLSLQAKGSDTTSNGCNEVLHVLTYDVCCDL